MVDIKNPHKDTKIELIAQDMVGIPTFTGWLFLQECLVVAVSDSLFKYEQMSVVSGSPPKIISNPHVPHGSRRWKLGIIMGSARQQDPGILGRRYDPEMAILGLSVLTVSAPARPHKDRVGQNSIIFVRILDLTYPQTVVVRIVDQTCKYRESVRIIYMTS
jgi:hypothetical protein